MKKIAGQAESPLDVVVVEDDGRGFESSREGGARACLKKMRKNRKNCEY
jgi:hypothetical protein